jgi:hypothetical protein
LLVLATEPLLLHCKTPLDVRVGHALQLRRERVDEELGAIPTRPIVSATTSARK